MRGLRAAILLVAAAGCSRAARPAGSPTADLEAIYRARSDSAARRYTPADVRFMTGMIAHHAQALVMAALAPVNRASPAVQTLAARVINAQRDEIATLQQWLRDRGQPVPEVPAGGAMMMVHGPGAEMHMPGMLTAEQMRELGAAAGPAFDRLFLTYMIQHHRGAVTMVHELFASSGGSAQDEVVFKLASDIQVDQLTEIARMELMLQGLPQPGSAPH